MKKLDFHEVRGFSDSFTFTFNFVKQEFVPLLKVFSVIALPVIFVDLFVKSSLVRGTLAFAIDQASDNGTNIFGLGNALWSYLSAAIAFLWMLLIVVAYIRVYLDKYRQQLQERITVGEVWKVMCPRIGGILGWVILYFLMVCVGLVLLIAPGIYLGVAFIFTTYYMMLRDMPLFSGMSASMALVRGQWWSLLGYLILLQLIVAGLGYAFSIPYLVISFKSLVSQQVPGVYETTFGLLVSTLGQYFLQIILIVGIGERFFSSLEQREHTTLLNKIDEIGTTAARE